MRTRNVVSLLVLGALALGAAAVLAMTLRPHDFVSTAQAQGGPSVALDMNIDNGSGPCNPIDDTVSAEKGSEYKVAVCLTGVTSPPAAIEMSLTSDKSLSQCVPVECTDKDCLDGNPDANAGTTTWGTSLGANWDCSVMDINPPTCDLNGQVHLECMTMGDGTLPVGPEVSAPVAVISFKATAEGTDTISVDSATFFSSDVSSILSCPDPSLCPTGSVTITAVGAPTATAASSPVPGAATATGAAVTADTTPGATSTPGGKATAKPTAAAGEGGGSSGPSAGIIAAIVVGAVIVVGGVGWFGWRRLRAG